MTDNPLFNITKNQQSLCIDLCSKMENIDKVSNETKQFLEERGLSDVAFDVCLVLREGLSNAVRHAHQSDPQKIIKYVLKIHEKNLLIEIEDEGDGFDWQSTMGRLKHLDQDSLLEHGRGFKIMNQYFNEFKYNEKGNKLFLKKNVNT